jgi:hypothetical protein
MPHTRSHSQTAEPPHPGIVELSASPRARLSCLRSSRKDVDAKRTRAMKVTFAQQERTVREFFRSAPPTRIFSSINEDDDDDDDESLRPMRPLPQRQKRAAAKQAARSLTRKTKVYGLLNDEQLRSSKSCSDQLFAQQLAQTEAVSLTTVEHVLEQLQFLREGMESEEEHTARVRRLHELVNFSVNVTSGRRRSSLCMSNALLAVFLSNGYESIQDILEEELTMEDCEKMLGTVLLQDQELVLKGMGVRREVDMVNEAMDDGDADDADDGDDAAPSGNDAPQANKRARISIAGGTSSDAGTPLEAHVGAGDDSGGGGRSAQACYDCEGEVDGEGVTSGGVPSMNPTAASFVPQSPALTLPDGYELAPIPHQDVLQPGSAVRNTIFDQAVMIKWPEHGWCLGHIARAAPVNCNDASSDGSKATYEVHYCENREQPYVATSHSYHLLSVERHSSMASAPTWSWTLVRVKTTAQPLSPVSARERSADEETRGCGWPGCPGHAARFDRVRLLQHARQAHSGMLDDARMRWAGGHKCPTCGMPYTAATMHAHHRKDPITGQRRCPMAQRQHGSQINVSPADEAYVRGLPVADVYIQRTSSMRFLNSEISRAVGAVVAPLLNACEQTPRDAYKHRLLHVVLAILTRPVGKARSAVRTVEERCRLLAEGGHVQRLYEQEIPPPQSGTKQRRQQRAEETTVEERAAHRRRQRAVSLVHAAEPGAARRVIENTSHLGELRPSDVLQTGERGEVAVAKVGTVVAEMQTKHPGALPADKVLPGLDTLLAGAGWQHNTAPPSRHELRKQLLDLFEIDLFQQYLGGLPKRRMAGHDAIRFEHVVGMAKAGYTLQIMNYIKLIAVGDLPDEMRPFAYGGALVAPSKPGSDTEHRPLGAGVVWRRITAGYLAKQYKETFAEKFGPLQLGVGISRGPDILALVVRLALEQNKSWVAVKLDFKNAFNMVSRLSFLKYTAKHHPELLLFLLAAYGVPPYIIARGPDGCVRYLSQRGCTQGCPLGPYCFAAALQETLERVQANNPRVLVAALHDDVELAGSPDDVRVALDQLLREASVCGLEPAAHKFTLYVQDASMLSRVAVQAIEKDIEEWTDINVLAAGKKCSAQSEGLVTAGAPIGTTEFQLQHVTNKLHEHKYAHEQLAMLTDTQAAYLLLRYCLSIRLHYLIGIVGPTLLQEQHGIPSALKLNDELMLTTLQHLLTDPTRPHEARVAEAAAPLPATTWAQAQLRAKDGGLNIPGAEHMWAACHLGRSTAVLTYITEHANAYNLNGEVLQAADGLPFFDGLRTALTRLHAQSDAAANQWPTLRNLLTASPTQHDIAEGVYLKSWAQVLAAQPDDHHRARFLSAGGQHAGTWLAAFPMSMWTTARARHYQLALSMRLGMPLPELSPIRGVPRHCSATGCGMQVDPFGFHSGNCRAGNRWGLWTNRHDTVQMAILYVLRNSGRRAMACSAGSGNWFGARARRTGAKGGYKRADLVMPNYYGLGRHLFLDIAVAEPTAGYALSATPSSAARAGVAADVRAARKCAKYSDLAAGVSSDFQPACIERYGTMCGALVGLIKSMVGDRARDAFFDDEYAFSTSSSTTHAASKITFAACMADAAMVERVVEAEGKGMQSTAASRHAFMDMANLTPLTQRQIEGSVGGRAYYEPAY